MSDKSPAIKHAWVIRDANPGHYNQSLAIAEGLQDRIGLSYEWLDAQSSLRGFLRLVLAKLINISSFAFPDRFMRHCYSYSALPDHRPDLIISSGGKTAALNVMLTRKFKAKNIFIGYGGKVDPDQFTVLLEQEPSLTHHCIVYDYLPTRITPVKANAAGLQFRQDNQMGAKALWCVLIGGVSRSHPYRDSDWLQLAQAMNRLAEKYAIQWLVTTSRRSGARIERLLKDHLDPAILADATWWSEAPRKVVLAYLGASELVFCTQDSLTMLTEAVFSGKPVYSLQPDQLTFKEGNQSYYVKYLNNLTRTQKIIRSTFAELADRDIAQDQQDAFSPLIDSPLNPLIDQILERL